LIDSNLQQSSSFMLFMSYYDAGRQAKEINSSMGVVWQQLLLWTAIMECTLFNWQYTIPESRNFLNMKGVPSQMFKNDWGKQTNFLHE